MEQFENKFQKEIQRLNLLKEVVPSENLQKKIDYHFDAEVINNSYLSATKAKISSLSLLVLMLLLIGSSLAIANSKPGSYLYTVKVLFGKLHVNSNLNPSINETEPLNLNTITETPVITGNASGIAKTNPDGTTGSNANNRNDQPVLSANVENLIISPTPTIEQNKVIPSLDTNLESTVNSLLDNTINGSSESGINVNVNLHLKDLVLPLGL